MGVKKGTNLAELIPISVGKGTLRKQIQNRSLRIWSILAFVGLTAFYQKYYDVPDKLRAAALGAVFPGAGFVACANIAGGVGFVITFLLLPFTMLAWFGAGGIAFPISLWILSTTGAYFAAGESVFEYAGLVDGILLVAFVSWQRINANKSNAKASAKRQARNDFIPAELVKQETQSVAPAADADRELTLPELRMIQYLIEQGLRDFDDWTGFNIIDQFQTSALRYQLYEITYNIGAYQGIYAPNFHGYVSESFRKTIEKSCTKKVMNFWKWEALWGKFTTNTDPLKEDNIMVSGYILESIMLYTANTGDLRYTKPGSINFQITNSDSYAYDVHSIDETLVRQWQGSEYCLFPCEPNWIYTPCNFQGMTGQVIYDRYFNKNHISTFIDKFEASLNTDFTEPDGSILPIRSSLTGFTIPGLCGALTDCFNALLCRGYLDHVARRMWAIFRHECVRYDPKTGDLSFAGLVGADQMDPGNYKKSEYNIYSIVALVAGEFGDEPVRLAALKTLRREVGLETVASGATRLKASIASPAMNACMVRGELLRREDWKNLVSKGPSKTTLAGPILYEVPLPGVLVAKARSHTSKDLDLVLYPSAAAGTFSIGIERLVPGKNYNINGSQTQKADSQGRMSVAVKVDGRTPVVITPVKE